MFNVSAGFMIKDSYSKSNGTIDAIIDEYNQYGNQINYYGGRIHQYIVVTDLSTKTDSVYLAIKFDNKVKNFDQTTINHLRNEAKKNYLFLDSIIPLLNFKRNKDAFSLLSKHFKGLEVYFKNPICDTCLIENIKYNYPNSKKIVFEKKVYRIEKIVYENLDESNKLSNSLIEGIEYAKIPNTIVSKLVYPSEYLLEKLGFKSEKTVRFIVK